MNDEIVKELKEQTKWLRILALNNIRQAADANVQTKEERGIYNLSDGRSIRDIIKELSKQSIKVNYNTIHRFWKKCALSGIIVPSEQYAGRFEKIIDIK